MSGQLDAIKAEFAIALYFLYLSKKREVIHNFPLPIGTSRKKIYHTPLTTTKNIAKILNTDSELKNVAAIINNYFNKFLR